MSLLLLLLACGTSPPPAETTPSAAPEVAAPEPEPEPEPWDPNAPIEGALANHTVRLEPGAETLKLVVLDASGTAIAAKEPAMVVLTGNDQEPQKIKMKPDGDAWTGAASAEGATGYLAVVTLRLNGLQRTSRITWGEDRPDATPGKPAPKTEEAEEGTGD